MGNTGMKFEWDDTKAAKNIKKHGVTFNEASTVFGDPLAITYADPEHSIGEYYYLTFGRSIMNRLIVVAHSDRNDRVSLISAREMTRSERKDYEEIR